ncbi:J domain-containing protein, partial [Rubrivirga sp.]|uniref:J domain-containing protein n=1 Tax=Rubrivirga sp. TaxID=1885344 RepID=UPI003C766597
GGSREYKTPSCDPVRVTVPTGVRDGFKIKLGGRGEASPDGRGAPGDLFLTFRVTPNAQFSREGDDLVTTETISAIEAMIGTTREVTTAYGRTVRLKVKPGTQPGARLRVRGQGVETDASKGDLYVVLEVDVPALEGETADQLREWADSAGLV